MSVCIFVNILMFTPWLLNVLYAKFCYVSLSDCWREYVTLSHKYEWRHELTELAGRCLEEEANMEMGSALNTELNDSFLEIVRKVNAVVRDIALACDVLNLNNCVREARLISSEFERAFVTSSKR